MRIKILLVLLALFAFAGKGFASLDQTKLDQIFAAAVEAVGGKEAVGRIRSIEAVAACIGPEGNYTTSITSFRNAKTRFKQTYSYRDSATDIFINDQLGWQKSSETGEFSIISPFQKLVVNLHEYQRMAFGFQEMFTDFEFAGEESFDDRSSWKVLAKNELGSVIELFFDKETKMLNGYILPIPNSPESVKNVFNEWKTVGGLKLPAVITATDKQGDWILTFHTIELNKADEKALDVPPRVADLAELLKLHDQAKEAHLAYNAELFIELFAENLTQLQGGNVSTRSKAENLERFRNYFSTYKFIEWEDIKPPVIKISGDGTLATVLVEKRVRGTYKNEQGEEVSDHIVFAWLEVWEKIGGKWKVTTVASTSRAGQNSSQ